MDRWAGKVAVVTGASSGIGLQTAQSLLKQGLIVVGLARRRDKMEEAMEGVDGEFHAIECDVTNEERVVEVFDSIKTNLGAIHILINNAGIIRLGTITDSDISSLKQVIDVNINGFLYCAKEAIKVMKEGDYEAQIINIGSTLGNKISYSPDFTTNVYSATKFAVRAISETLSNELLGSKIRVTLINPAMVKTECLMVAGIEDPYTESTKALDPEDVADVIIYVISAKPHVNLPELNVQHNEANR